MSIVHCPRNRTDLWQESLKYLTEGLYLGNGRLIHNLHKVFATVLQGGLHIAVKQPGKQWPVLCSLDFLNPGVDSLWTPQSLS